MLVPAVAVITPRSTTRNRPQTHLTYDTERCEETEEVQDQEHAGQVAIMSTSVLSWSSAFQPLRRGGGGG
ncbi:hypothetical protein UK23_43835, partial [Lentzea aerocolonigenes]